ncbi:OmpA family protein [Polyangium aurulentum]|uniref:OmpA family protein n=1 Tax=Polyangium aurulentum TaxID=2567896 RepID=UPI0010AE6791|nr:OmpA family protein [Polyangium aurulentum]UQA57957.1 OmpA family protein [Polyangium aurulentum]
MRDSTARYRWVPRLRGGLVLAARALPALLLAACASAPPPAPLTEADALLGRKDVGDIRIARPELISEARDLLRRAKTAHSLGDVERATLLAHQAIQLFTSAKNLIERDEAERLLRVVNKAAGESEEEQRRAALEAKLRGLEAQRESSPEANRAMRAIDTARDKQSTALEKGAIGGSAGVYFQQGQSLLEAAIDAFEEKSYAKATNAGQSAATSFSSAIGAMEKEKGAGEKGADGAKAETPQPRDEKAEAPAAGTKAEAKAAPEGARRAGAATRAPAASVSLEALADRTIVQLELRRAEALGELKDQKCPGTFREMEAMLAIAQKRFGAADYEHAYEYALRADERFRACEKPATAERGAAPSAAQQPSQKRPEPAALPLRMECNEAKALLAEARALDRNINDARLDAGGIRRRARAGVALSTAEEKLNQRSCDEALMFAREASDTFFSLAGGAAPPAQQSAPAKPAPARAEPPPVAQPSPPPQTQPSMTIQVQAPPPVPPAPPGTTVRIVDERSAAREEQFLAERLAQMAQTLARVEAQKQGAVAVDASWRPAYERVFRALSLRDRAKLRSPDAKKKLEEADGLLEQSRAAWRTKRYLDAMRFADDASAILGPLAEAKAEGGTTEELEEKTRKADELIREASVGQQVCEKEACSDRDLAGYATAKELLASARQAYVDKRYGYAIELAGKAKEGLAAVLQKPRKDAPDPKIEIEKLEALQEAADASLREANITKKICETRSCRAFDGDGWIRATEYIASAQAAYVDKRYDVAKNLADRADKLFKDVLAKQPEFVIPPGLTLVARSGSQLRLNPPVKFAKGTTMTPQSEASTDELAKVLIHNKAVLKRVSLIGYTDNRGYGPTNKKLSADRAAALRQALIKRGVPADLLASDGRGADNPVADNATPQGREDNRRIEISIELVEGAK